VAIGRAGNGGPSTSTQPAVLLRNVPLVVVGLVAVLSGALILAIDGQWPPMLGLLSYVTASASAILLRARLLKVRAFETRALPLALILLGMTAALLVVAFFLADDWRSQIVVGWFGVAAALASFGLAHRPPAKRIR
jgi:hypothetical protein